MVLSSKYRPTAKATIAGRSMALANTWFDGGQFAKALETYEEILIRQPDNLLALVSASKCQIELGNLETAQERLVCAYQISRELPQPCLLLAHIAMENDNLPEAETWVLRSMKYNKDSFETYALAGLIYHRSEAWKDAEYCLKRALSLEPKRPLLWFLRAKVLRHDGRYEAALKSVRRGLVDSPYSPYLLYEKGLIEQLLELHDAADQSFKLAASANPVHRFVGSFRVRAHMRNKLYETARTEIEVLIRMHPRLLRLRLTQADLYLALAENQKAEEVLRAAIELDPSEADVHFLFAKYHLSQMEPIDAQSALQQALELSPSHPQANLAISKIYSDSGQTELADLHRMRALAGIAISDDQILTQTRHAIS